MAIDINFLFTKFELTTINLVFKSNFNSYDSFTEKFTNIHDVLNELFEIYVPSSGSADTIGGECVRALNQVVYRYYNNGDVVGYDYGLETTSNQLGYLVKTIPELSTIADELITYFSPCPGYVNALDDLISNTISELFIKYTLFTIHNTENSFKNDYWQYLFDDEDDYNCRLNGEED